MSDDFAVFSADGKLQGNLTSSQGVAPSLSEGLGVLQSTAASVGIGPSAAAAGQSTVNVTSNYPGFTLPNLGADSSTVAAVKGAAGAASSIGDLATSLKNTDWSHWLVRIVVMLLGFIFVAVGLAMFGLRNPVATAVTQVTKRTGF